MRAGSRTAGYFAEKSRTTDAFEESGLVEQ